MTPTDRRRILRILSDTAERNASLAFTYEQAGSYKSAALHKDVVWAIHALLQQNAELRRALRKSKLPPVLKNLRRLTDLVTGEIV